MDIEQFVRDVRAAGGASVNMAGQRPVTGYMVGMPGTEFTVPVAEFDEGTVAEYLGLYGPLLHVGANTYLGAWESDGTVYLDVSAQFMVRQEAIEAGQIADQLAIYDVEAGDDIKLA